MLNNNPVKSLAEQLNGVISTGTRSIQVTTEGGKMVFVVPEVNTLFEAKEAFNADPTPENLKVIFKAVAICKQAHCASRFNWKNIDSLLEQLQTLLPEERSENRARFRIS
jgi:hypothetical protein